MTLDRKSLKIKKELSKVAEALESTEREKEGIERGKVQQVRAWRKLQKLKEESLGSFLEQRAEEIGFQNRRRFLQTPPVYSLFGH